MAQWWALVGAHRHVLIYRHYKLHLDIMWLVTKKSSGIFKNVSRISPGNWLRWICRYPVHWQWQEMEWKTEWTSLYCWTLSRLPLVRCMFLGSDVWWRRFTTDNHGDVGEKAAVGQLQGDCTGSVASVQKGCHIYLYVYTRTCLMALCPGLSRWAGTRKIKQIWILLKQETVSGSGIIWAICKSAPRCRQITMPAPHHSVFLEAGCPFCRPTYSVKALKATFTYTPWVKKNKTPNSWP